MTLKNIVDLVVNQIRIFPVDVVPLGLINTKSCVESIKNTLSISEVGVLPSVDGKDVIVFRKGELKENNELVVINKVEVDPRRIIIEVAGSSKAGNKVYELFVSSLTALTDLDLENLHSPLLLAETTRCVATLDFTFEELFNHSFTEFLNKRVEKEATNDAAEGSVRPLAAIAEISYRIKDESLVSNRISMNPKQFTIAPRPGAPLDEKRYVISSPFNSDTHIKLIKELNKAIVNTGKTNRGL
jgi:hypothetical protein